MDKKRPFLIKSVDKALRVIECFNLMERELGVSEISRRLNLNKSTVQRLFATLKSRGYVSQNGETAKYSLSVKFLKIASIVLGRLDMRYAALPYMRELSEKTSEAVNLGILEDFEVIYIEKVESNQLVHVGSRVGEGIPANCCALGKVILAYMPDGDRRAAVFAQRKLIGLAKRSITDPQKLEQELSKVRKQGYALDDRETGDEVLCVAAPIIDHLGRVHASISCSLPFHRASKERLEEIIIQVKETAKKISSVLGYGSL